MESRSYFVRLLAVSLAALAVAAVFVFLRANAKAQTQLVEEFEAREQRTLDVAAWVLTDKAPGAGQADLTGLVDELGRRLGVRVTYVSGGKVLADSEVAPGQLAELPDHSDRPEIRQATAQGFGKATRHSETLGKDMLYMARAVDARPGLAAGVLRIAAPYSDVARDLDASRDRVLALVAVMALCAAGLAAFVLVRARRVLGIFSRAVETIAGGDVPDKLRVYPGSEFKSLAESINALSKKLRKNRRTLLDTTSQYEAVLDKMTDAVAVLDDSGQVLTHNPALATLIGREAIDGRHALELGLGVEVHEALKRSLARDAPEPTRFPTTLAPDKDMDVDLVPFSTARGKRRFILVARDVTALRSAERLLRTFVINASHQLRTPLTSIRGFAATLLDNPPADADKARGMLETVLKRSEEMSVVITELLQTAAPQAPQHRPDDETAGR